MRGSQRGWYDGRRRQPLIGACFLVLAIGTTKTCCRKVGAAMNSLSVLKIKTVDPHAVDPKSHKQDYVKPKSGPISLLSVLEADNFRLRQAVVELSLDTLVLREALKELRPEPRISGRGD